MSPTQKNRARNKLTLHKETIRSLTHADLADVAGGRNTGRDCNFYAGGFTTLHSKILAVACTTDTVATATITLTYQDPTR